MAITEYRDSWASAPALHSRVSGVPGATQALTKYAVAQARRRDRQAVAMARRFRPELTVVLKGEVYPSEVWAELKRHTVGPLVTWWLDDPFVYPQSVRDFRFFDRVFLFDRSYFEPLALAGVTQTAFLPCACDETVYRPQSLSASDRQRLATEVAFVGSYYPNRAALVRSLADSLEIGVWGTRWQVPEARQDLDGSPAFLRGGAVTDTVASKIYAATLVGLNVHHPQTRLAGLNMRTFELLGAGVAQLVDWIPGIEELLEPGREIVCYRSVEEAKELARALVKDGARRQELGRRGRERILREHTYVARMRTLCETAFH